MLIGEVARRCGISTRMLRHYDTLGLVRPSGRTVGGYREYTAADLRRIFHVESLRSLGLSLRQIARVLQDPGFTPSALIGELIASSQQRLRREQELLERLRTVEASTPQDWPGVTRIVELLHDLRSPSAARRQRSVLADTALPADLLAGAVLAETDPNVAGALRWALARAGDAAVAGVAGGVHAGDPGVRRRAVQALAAIGGAQTTTLLTGALADPDPAVRRHAALAAGRRGVTAAAPTLIAMIVEGAGDVEAAEVLGALAGDPADACSIVAALTARLHAHPGHPTARVRLTQALAEMPAALARDVLRSLTGDPEPAVALTATAILRRLDPPDAG
ncbi:HEAT repeat domain-containing protein [Actinoplanes teichomyceticus]|uniref:DNA-binding transcriptional MerR regulator n=1 Tax=Actinoplanes teichomyceticus TaxID=1867 RepID=A0A561VMK7_ACTTI|nr:HEAT repeat domain-containing protein [Actinoplanes teichomyceticus]TWG12837.1 DNA-binding transcriptional MerR regulator [Actinoplanes teichomyceticus]GIF13584.1 MerR family transcriptional regulator [Actinoplanes teichomyceticus]